MTEYYHLFKSLHIISVISWMVGMLYLPRLYVYHCRTKLGSEMDQTFQIMERRLLRCIINPAMIATVTFGILLVCSLGGMAAMGGWFHAKLLFVLLMTGVHGFFAKCRKDFANGQNKHSEKFYRIINEIPTIIMIIIVFLTIYK